MRESIGATWLFQIVIFFVIVFTGYMCLTINHSKSFQIKDSIINIIEDSKGMDLRVGANNGNTELKEIAEVLKEYGYRSSGKCENLDKENSDGKVLADGSSASWQGYDREGNLTEKNATFCIKKIHAASGLTELPEQYYYKVAVFYQLDIPIIGNLMNFHVLGDTKIVYEHKPIEK